MTRTFLDNNFHLEVGRDQRENDDEYNNYRKAWHELPLYRNPGSFPLHLDIELTTTCNLKCIQCFQSFDPPEPQFMDFELYKKIIDQGPKAVKLNYRGEPLLYPKDCMLDHNNCSQLNFP